MSSVLLCGSTDAVGAVAQALSGTDVTVRRGRDVVDAIERLETSAVDCVVTPASVGELTAGQFVRELQSRGHGQPVVMLASEEDVEQVIEADVAEVTPAADPERAAE
jgi:DNA-binding NtrC family response regulator